MGPGNVTNPPSGQRRTGQGERLVQAAAVERGQPTEPTPQPMPNAEELAAIQAFLVQYRTESNNSSGL